VGLKERTAALHFDINGRLYSAAPSAECTAADLCQQRSDDVGGRTGTTGNPLATLEGLFHPSGL
jgi:hypothetical protein